MQSSKAQKKLLDPEATGSGWLGPSEGAMVSQSTAGEGPCAEGRGHAVNVSVTHPNQVRPYPWQSLFPAPPRRLLLSVRPCRDFVCRLNPGESRITWVQSPRDGSQTEKHRGSGGQVHCGRGLVGWGGARAGLHLIRSGRGCVPGMANGAGSGQGVVGVASRAWRVLVGVASGGMQGVGVACQQDFDCGAGSDCAVQDVTVGRGVA